MKKIITSIFLSCLTAALFGQANTYFHDRIDTTLFAIADTVGHGANHYYATNLTPDFNVKQYVNGCTVNLFFKKGNTGSSTLTLVTKTGTLSSKTIRKANGQVLLSGDIPDSTAVILDYYNGSFRIAGIGVTASSSSWLLTGNSGTTAGTNFLGTTDAVDMVLKTNNTEKARISSAGILSLGLASTNNGSLLFRNSTNANTLTINSGVTSASYALTLPTAQGAANSLLLNNGAGVLSWNTGTGLFWALDGNTVGAEKYIGTNDAFDFPIRTNGIERGRVSSAGLWGINASPIVGTLWYQQSNGTTNATYNAQFFNSTPTLLFAIRDDGLIEAGVLGANLGSLSIGRNVGFDRTLRGNTFLGVDISTMLTTAQDNVVIGWESGKVINSAFSNVVIGMRAGSLLSSGSTNVAIGASAMLSNIVGVRNVVIGSEALKNNTSDQNVAIGYTTLLTNTTGFQNTCIGEASFFTNSVGTLNVGLGFKAGYYETGSNKLFIDNSSRANEADGRIKALIYGIFDAVETSQELHFNSGVVDINGRLQTQQGTDVASSSTITLTYTGNVFELTGTTAVDFITTTGWQEGSEITLIANENVTINDDAGGGNLRLAGNANFAMTADDVLTLIYSSTTAGGIIWREKSRSVN